LQWRLSVAALQTEGLKHSRHNQFGILKRGQRDETDTIGEVIAQVGRDLEHQARLAHASGAGKGEQTDLWAQEQGRSCSDLSLAPNECREGQGDGGGAPAFVLEGSRSDGWFIGGGNRLSVTKGSISVRPFRLGTHLLLALSEQLPCYGIQ